MMYYLKALLFTILVECGIVLIQSRNFKWTLYVLLINVITNPVINLIYRGLYPVLPRGTAYIFLGVLEMIVVIAEGALVYILRRSGNFRVRALSLSRSLLYAFVLNAASFVFGLIIFAS